MKKYLFFCLIVLFLASCQVDSIPKLPENCANLTSDFKDFCILNSTIISERAPDCTLIKNPEIKDLCYLKISAKNNDAELCSNVKLRENVELCYFGIAAKTKNPTICDELSQNTTFVYKKEICIKVASLNEQNPKYANSETQNAHEELRIVYYRTTIAQDDLMNEEMQKLS